VRNIQHRDKSTKSVIGLIFIGILLYIILGLVIPPEYNEKGYICSLFPGVSSGIMKASMVRDRARWLDDSTTGFLYLQFLF
jgi:uncharacterized membrane protein YiaA